MNKGMDREQVVYRNTALALRILTNTPILCRCGEHAAIIDALLRQLNAFDQDNRVNVEDDWKAIKRLLSINGML